MNHIYGCAAVVPALVAAGLNVAHPAIRRAVAWLEAVQNCDGGWGEDPCSYAHTEWIGKGPSTASQTARALLALTSAGERTCPAVERGIPWLIRTQQEDESWDEPHYTGSGFGADFPPSTTSSTHRSSPYRPWDATCRAGTTEDWTNRETQHVPSRSRASSADHTRRRRCSR